MCGERQSSYCHWCVLEGRSYVERYVLWGAGTFHRKKQMFFKKSVDKVLRAGCMGRHNTLLPYLLHATSIPASYWPEKPAVTLPGPWDRERRRKVEFLQNSSTDYLGQRGWKNPSSEWTEMPGVRIVTYIDLYLRSFDNWYEINMYIWKLGKGIFLTFCLKWMLLCITFSSGKGVENVSNFWLLLKYF